MKKMTKLEAAEILLKNGIDEYLKSGVTKRVQFQDVADKENVDFKIMKNGFNHLVMTKIIQGDSGGGFNIKP